MSVLKEADAAVNGPRARDYGHPSDNHGCTASMMQAYLARRYGSAHFDELDVCAFNMLQKVSRLANTPTHHDSLVDIAGYAENWAMVLEVWRKRDDGLRQVIEDLAGG